MPSNLRQPNPKKFLGLIEQLQDLNAQQAGELQTMQEAAEVAALDFNIDNVSQESCEEITKLFEKLRKQMSESYYRLGVAQGMAASFLSNDTSEGSVPPCECL